LGDSINTIKENSETLLKANRDIGLEINAEKTKYMIMSCHPNSGQNQNMTANESFKRVAKFKYLGTTLTNQNGIHDEIKNRLNLGNACYYSVQNIFFSSCLISKNLKIKIYKTVILPAVLYGWETWSLTLEEEHNLRVFENRVLRKIFGPKREEDGSWRKLHNDKLYNLYSSLNIVRVIKSRMMMGVGHMACMHACMQEGGGVYRVLVVRPKGERPLGRPRCRWEDNIKMDLREIGINGANWIWLAQDRVQWQAFVNMVMNLQVP
jgi:hypothetical protein